MNILLLRIFPEEDRNFCTKDVDYRKNIAEKETKIQTHSIVVFGNVYRLSVNL
jgi:hypothetical protein